MTLYEIASQVGISTALSTALSAALLFLTRTWISERIRSEIKHEYDQRLETHKAQLKGQTDVEVERLRSELSIMAAERQIRFTHLHEKRAEVIADCYRLLVRVLKALLDYVSLFERSDDPRQDRRERARVAFNEFRPFFEEKRLFIPTAAAARIDGIVSDVISSFNEFAIFVDQPDATETQRWVEISKKVEVQIDSALQQLELEFRRTLGDDPPEFL